MSTTTIWKCDRCSKEWNSNDGGNPLEEVKVVSGQYEDPGKISPADWCQDCRIETGIYRPHLINKNGKRIKLEKKSLPPPLTLEELVREIVREEIAVT